MIFKDLERKLQIDVGKGVLKGKNGEDLINSLNEYINSLERILKAGKPDGNLREHQSRFLQGGGLDRRLEKSQ